MRDVAGERQSDTDHGRLLLFGLAGLLAIRLLALLVNRTDLFFDEAQYWSWAQVPALGYYSKPPLIAWIIAATTSVCGDGEVCVRIASPIVHTATAGLVWLVGQRLYGTRVGFWSAVVYATLPGVSFSSGLISTDVPLLLAWAGALLALVRLSETGSLGDAALLGLAIGVGLLAKYAMAFFAVSLAIAYLIAPRTLTKVRGRALLVAAACAAAIVAPNLVWNAGNGFSTFGHTADNAHWGQAWPRPLKALEFLAGQLGVFGPILFVALALIALRALRQRLEPNDRLLLAFSVPIVLAYTGQALLSRAHANWAAVAYVAACVLVARVMLADGALGWLKGSTALHLAIIVLLAVGGATAGRLELPGDPYSRLLGWRAKAEATRRVLDEARAGGKPFAIVIADDRAMIAEFVYYLRDADTPVRAWKSGTVARDHFELTRAFDGPATAEALLVSPTAEVTHITARFGAVTAIGTADVTQGSPAQRRLYYFRLSGFRG